MNKKTIEKILTSMPGFRKSGSFYIGTCSDSVLAGYCLDAPPHSVYVWSFFLPSYDNIEFLHLSLGKRILDLSPSNGGTEDNVEPADFLRRHWSGLSKVGDSESLIERIDSEELDGTYALWVRYLTHIRSREFSEAERLDTDADVTKRFFELQAISRSYSELSYAKTLKGWEGCANLIGEWLHKTKAKYC